MEELDVLKKHWKKEDNFPKINKDEIRRMLHKSSSSILKWILIICCFEFSIGLTLKIKYIFFDDTKMSSYDITIEAMATLVTAYFIYLFLNEYKKIKLFTDTKSLMSSILKSRNWVKKYIFFTIGIIVLQILISIFNNTLFNDFKRGYTNDNKLSYSNDTLLIILLITFAIIALFLFLYYRLIYVQLLKKLKNNYNELVKLED